MPTPIIPDAAARPAPFPSPLAVVRSLLVAAETAIFASHDDAARAAGLVVTRPRPGVRSVRSPLFAQRSGSTR